MKSSLLTFSFAALLSNRSTHAFITVKRSTSLLLMIPHQARYDERILSQISASTTSTSNSRRTTTNRTRGPEETRNFSTLNASSSSSNNISSNNNVDLEYPGTAIQRMKNVRARVATLSKEDLSGDWEVVRRKLLWAGGLRDLPDAIPGQGYTGHSFNDFNHVDLTAMNDDTSDNLNDGEVKQIAVGNFLGEGIRKASMPELGPGGSWSTCAIGCNVSPPRDVAHKQFHSRIAFKLVWVPNDNFDMFALVDDDGNELARGKPRGDLPALRERLMNYRLVQSSKYAHVVDEIAANSVV